MRRTEYLTGGLANAAQNKELQRRDCLQMAWVQISLLLLLCGIVIGCHAASLVGLSRNDSTWFSIYNQVNSSVCGVGCGGYVSLRERMGIDRLTVRVWFLLVELRM